MTRLSSVELGVASYFKVPEVVAYAQEAERAGFTRFWLAENYYFRTSTVLGAAAALGTSSIGLGLGVLNPFTRLAPLIAMETATLDELSRGRVTLSLGTGRTPERHLGLDRAQSLHRLRETVDICRRLWAGETLGHEGRVYHVAPGMMRLGFPPQRPRVPIYLAGMGPKTLRLAAEKGDGVFLDVFTSPGFVRGMLHHVEAGAAASGRALADLFVGTYVVFAVDRDGRAARDLVKPTLVDYLRARMIADDRMGLAGIQPEAFARVRADLQAAWERGGMADAVKAVPDWICDALTVCGTPDECCAGLQRFADAGVRTVVLFNVLGRDPRAAIRLIAHEIVPRVV